MLNGEKNTISHFLLYIMCLSVTFGSRFLSISFGANQLTLFRLATFILFVVFLISQGRHIYLVRRNDLSYNFMVFLFLYSLVTVVWCKDLSNWIQSEFFILIAFVLFYITSFYVRDETELIKCLRAFEISILIQAAIGVYEYYTGNYLFLQDSYRVFSYTRYGVNYPVAMQHNVNNFGMLMVFGVCLEYTFFKASKRAFAKIIHILIMILMSWLTYESTSRGALLALGIVFACIFLFFTKGIGKKLLVLIAALSAGVFFLAYVMSVLQFGAMEEDIRTKLAINGLHFLLETFTFGTGSGQSEWWFAHRSIISCGRISIYHNTWVEMLATYGLVVFVIFLIVYFKLMSRFYHLGKKDDGTVANIAQGFFLFQASFIIGCVTPSSMFILEWFWLVWVMMIVFYVENKQEIYV